jgi:predicted RND superfamily exporter protein
MMNAGDKSFGEFVIRRRWWIIAVSAVLFISASSGMTFLKTLSDSRAYFSEKNPQLMALEALEGIYSKDENILIAVEPKNRNVFTPEVLAAIEELTDESWKIPFSRSVNSLTNFQHTRADGDELMVGDLVRNAMELSGEEIEIARDRALNEPQLVNRLVSPSGHVAGVSILVVRPEEDPLETVEIMRHVSRMLDDFRQRHPALKVYVTGAVPLNNAFYEASNNDMMTLTPIMFAVMVIMMAVLIRSASGLVATLLIIVASTATGMGFAGWSGIYITDATASAPVIILTLAVADSIHILSTAFYEMRRGMPKNEAIVEALRINLHPVFLTSVTTAIGFLSMNFSEVPPFRELGNIVAVGVLAAYGYSIFFLPAVMSILPVRVRVKAGDACLPVERLGNFVVKRRVFLFWAMLGLMFVLAIGLFRIELSDNFVKYFDERYAIRTDSDYIQDNLTGMDLIEYSLGTGEEGGINSPVYLAQVEEFARWFRGQPEVIHVNSLTDIMKRLNRNMHDDDPAYYRVPENRELAAQYLLLYEMSLPFGLDMNSRINLDKSASRFTVTLKHMSTARLRGVEKRGNRWLKENAPGIFSPATGISIMFAHISERNIKSMLRGVVAALILISMILIFAFRSLKIGLLSLLPNLLPALMAFGFWGLVIVQVNLAVSVVGAISLGIIVDDTVHFMSKCLRARREMNMDILDAVHYSFMMVGTAIVTTSLVLISGFLVLTASGFAINSTMGLLTALTIGFALIADFFFLPPLLIKIEEQQK